jgi:hypothetical protein
MTQTVRLDVITSDYNNVADRVGINLDPYGEYSGYTIDVELPEGWTIERDCCDDQLPCSPDGELYDWSINRHGQIILLSGDRETRFALKKPVRVEG